jgi:Kef-type K+ transport system membrane component KefB
MKKFYQFIGLGASIWALVFSLEFLVSFRNIKTGEIMMLILFSIIGIISSIQSPKSNKASALAMLIIAFFLFFTGLEIQDYLIWKFGDSAFTIRFIIPSAFFIVGSILAYFKK